MEKFWFFNSAPGDPRVYQAQDFANYFGLVLTSGILAVNNQMGLQVKADGTDMRVYVEPGKAIIKGNAYENTANEYLTVDLPEATENRIDRIVLRHDLTNANRHIKVFVKRGTASAPPDLQRDNFVYEISLARVLLEANTSTIDPLNITDERMDENLAGIVHSMITVPTSQFQEQWDDWFNTNVPAYEQEWQNFMDTLTGQSPVMSVNGTTPDANGNVQVEVGDITASEVSIVDTGNKFTATDVEGALAENATKIGILSDSVVPYGTASGTNAKTISITDGFATLKTGLALSFKNTTANTGAVTLDVNGLGAKSVVKSGGTALSSGNLKAGGVYTVRYDGTSFILQGEGGSGNALASDLLSGKTASTDAGDITGTMPNRGIFDLALGATVPAGYYSGGTVPSGKRFATGTATVWGQSSLSVSGLAFAPTYVIFTSQTYVTRGFAIKSGAWAMFRDNFLESSDARTNGKSPSFTSSGFTMPSNSYGSTNDQFTWWAFE